MKILFIYRDYNGRREKYGEMMLKLGHKVKYVKLKNKVAAHQVSVSYIRKHSPDIIWLLQPGYIDKKVVDNEFLYEAKKIGIPIVTYFTYAMSAAYTSWNSCWEKFDILFIHNMELHNYLKSQGLNSYYMPIGFYPKMYSRCVKKAKDINVSFMGRAQTQLPPQRDRRARYLNKLAKYGLRVYGNTFKGRVMKGIPIQSYRDHSIQRDVYSRTKVNLDLPFLNSSLGFYKNKYHIKNRLFEIPATGNFLLTVKCEEFYNIFGDTIGYYDDNTSSLKGEVKRYIKDISKRQSMSEKAYKLVHEKHTFIRRFKKMFKIIKSSM